jgi:hypothetical protein
MKLNLARLLLFALSLGFVRMNAEAEENKDEARFLSNVRQLIFEGRRSGEGYFSLCVSTANSRLSDERL